MQIFSRCQPTSSCATCLAHLQFPGKVAVIMIHLLWTQIEWTGEVIQLAWKPRIFLYKKFLSDAECDHLKTKGAKDITPSEVITPRHTHDYL